MRKVIVVGASGVLGQLICTELLRIFDHQITLTITDYKPERGKKIADFLNGDVHFQYLDANNEDNINEVIKNVDIVIVALKQKHPYIQKACIENKIVCVDVTVDEDFMEDVNNLNQQAEENKVASIVMAGFFPGLSGLMVKKAVSTFEEITEINVGLLQNTNAKAGLTGILDMLNIITKPTHFENKRTSGFTIKKHMNFLTLLKPKQVRLIDHSEKMLLADKVPSHRLNYWTSWNSTTFNRLVSLIRRIGLIKYLHKIDRNILSRFVKHNPNKAENAFLTVEAKGIVGNKERIKRVSLSTFSDYHTTAMVTAAIAKIALHKNVTGVVSPFDITTVDEVLNIINCPDIKIEVYEK